MAHQPTSCPATGSGSCPLGIDPVSLAAINGQIANMTRVVMAAREDVAALRAEVKHFDKSMADVKQRQEDSAEAIRKLEDFKLVQAVQWNGPKRVIAVVAAVGVLISVVGGIVSILNGLGVIG